jgi:hypothetical protein
VFKFLLNILLIYAIFKVVKFLSSINKMTQHNLNEIKDMRQKMAKEQPQTKAQKKPQSMDQGEYVDYEELP